jgi:uncharacterized protein YukE
MANVSQADLTQMSVAAEYFQAAFEDCETVRKKVYENLAALQWGGGSATNFQNVMKEWDLRYNIVTQELVDMKNTLLGNKTEHRKSQEYQASVISQINKLLNGG